MGRSILICSMLIFYVTIVLGQKSYIQKYQPLADSLSRLYDIPSCVILGVAVVESSSGSGQVVKLLNNHFGIIGKNQLLKTKGIRTRYKYYPTDTASYIHFVQIISRRKFYKKFRTNRSCKEWIFAISNTGYSEKPEIWRKRIMNVIEKYKL